MVGYCSRPDPVAILHRGSEPLKGVVSVPVDSWVIGESWAGEKGLRHSRAGWVLAASEVGRLDSSGWPAEAGWSPCLFSVLCRAGAAGFEVWLVRCGIARRGGTPVSRGPAGREEAAWQLGRKDTRTRSLGGTQRACLPAAHAHLATRFGSCPGDLPAVLPDGQLVPVLEEGERAREAPGSAASSRGSLAPQRALGV